VLLLYIIFTWIVTIKPTSTHSENTVNLIYVQLAIITRPKSPASLLVHLCSWCYSIYGHEKHFSRLDHSEQKLQWKNKTNNFFFKRSKLKNYITDKTRRKSALHQESTV
jgi:hypothetical protein